VCARAAVWAARQGDIYIHKYMYIYIQTFIYIHVYVYSTQTWQGLDLAGTQIWQTRRFGYHADLARTQMWRARRFGQDADVAATPVWQVCRCGRHADLRFTRHWAHGGLAAGADLGRTATVFPSVAARPKSARLSHLRKGDTVKMCGAATSAETGRP